MVSFVIYGILYTHTVGGATLSQGQKLLSICNEFFDPHGVFCIDSAMWDPISPLNSAPANWSLADVYDKESTGSSSAKIVTKHQHLKAMHSLIIT